MTSVLAAYAFAVAILVSVLFQVALALGVPWGQFAMGGRFPGKFPPAMRLSALVQAVVLALLAAIVTSKAGIILPELFNVSATAIWIVVFVSGISLIMNLVTPSKWERILWAPVALVMTLSSLVVALY